jgi:biotin carboxyl carrier protein
MRRKFIVTIDRIVYEVEIEELEEVPEGIPSSDELSGAVPNVSEVSGEPPLPSEETLEEEVVISAPFPAQVLSIRKNLGDNVQEGEVLLILEAMKMEIEISSPKDGMVNEILVEEGKRVEPGDKLLILK